MSAIHFADSFTGTGALAGSSTEVGALTWAELVASLTRNNGALTGSGLDVVDAAWPNATVTVSGGVAYGRVVDADNWWRARIVSQQVVTGVVTSFDAWGEWSAWGNWSTPENFPSSGTGLPDTQDYYSFYRTTTVNGSGPTRDDQWPFGPSDARSRHRTRDVVTNTNYATYYSVVLEKSVAGTVSTVATSAQSSTNPGTVSLAALDNSLTATAGSLTVSATDAQFNAATKWGVAGAATDWSLDLVGANQPPAIVAPANNSDVDITNAVVTVKTGLPITDPPTSIDIQIKQGGDWAETDDAFTQVAGTTDQWVYTIPEADLTAGTQAEAQARVTDSNSNTSGWSASQFFTPRAKPSAPTFVSPAAGSDVVAGDIATVDFGTDSTARQARRVADDGSGNPDTTTVYQAALTITGPDGNGNYLLTGDGSIHPTGPEHVQARRQTADGGSLWSDWTDLLVTMQLAAPFTPLVGITKLSADAAIRFDFTCQGADVDHADTDHVDVYRDGVRVASVGVTNNAATWTDQVPGTASDYRIDAVAANTAITSWGVES